MALKCYPLQPGGLLLMEAMFIGMTTPEHMKHEMVVNIEVILLLVFMVVGIYFVKGLLHYLFTKPLIKLKNKIALSIAFAAACAVLSAFLYALTVVAVIITVGLGFHLIFHNVASGKDFHSAHEHSRDDEMLSLNRNDLEDFRAFLRNLMMHAVVGPALGGLIDENTMTNTL
jgi:NhaB family Na+:H+ antiporter